MKRNYLLIAATIVFTFSMQACQQTTTESGAAENNTVQETASDCSAANTSSTAASYITTCAATSTTFGISKLVDKGKIMILFGRTFNIGMISMATIINYWKVTVP